VRDQPAELEPDDLIRSLNDEWGLEVAAIDYSPVGFGSYHWVATDLTGTRWFATVDDLDVKPGLGDSRDSVFDGLKRAYETAVMLRDAGLRFVVAPIRGRDGGFLARISARYSVGLFPFVEGRAVDFGVYKTAQERLEIVALLTQLHQTTAAVRNVALPMDLDLPGRGDLEKALREVGEPWSGGPFSEPARRAVRTRASEIGELLSLFDRLCGEVATSTGSPVVTHGEPHAANFINTDLGPALIDWDTVALGPPERDLWMVVTAGGEEAAAYADVAGYQPDPVAIDFYRLTWDLKDLATYIQVLRLPHRESDDNLKAYQGLTKCVAIRDQWAALLK
jgi:spectinomycin phosphotransferase